MRAQGRGCHPQQPQQLALLPQGSNTLPQLRQQTGLADVGRGRVVLSVRPCVRQRTWQHRGVKRTERETTEHETKEHENNGTMEQRSNENSGARKQRDDGTKDGGTME